MNFYLSAVDDLLRHPDDQPSIGIILCAKNQVVAEYALRDIAKPVGVSSYITRLVESLPPALRDSLPSPQELEAGIEKGRLRQRLILRHEREQYTPPHLPLPSNADRATTVTELIDIATAAIIGPYVPKIPGAAAGIPTTL